MNFKNFNWLKDGLLPLSIAIMTICWLSPLMLWIKSLPVLAYDQPIFSPLSMAAILIASTFLTKVLLKQDWPIERIQALISGLGFFAILLFLRIEYYGVYSFFDLRWLGDLFWALSSILKGLPPQLLGLLLGAYLWRQGIGLGRRSVEFDDVFTAFRNGIIILVGLLILSLTSVHSEVFKAIQQQAVVAVLTFFFFSLLALALSRLEAVREEARRLEGKALSFNRDWLAAAVSSIIAIVFLGFVASSIFSFDLASRLLDLVLRVVDWILMVPLYLTFMIIGFFTEYLIYFFRLILEMLGKRGKFETPEAPEDLLDQEKMKKAAEARIPHEVIQVIEWVIIAAIIALVIYLFIKAVMRLRRYRTEEDVEEVHESLWSWQVFVDEVKAWLRSLWLRLVGRRKGPAKRAVLDRFRSDPQFQVSLSIRQIYQNLLSFAARLGFPKRLDQTPYEYLGVLEGALPLGREDLSAITEAYVQVRYSGEPAQAREFQVVDRAWSRVRAMLQAVEEERAKREREKGKEGKRGKQALAERGA